METNSGINKKQLAIVMGATGNMTFAIANVLIQLQKKSPNLKADFIIFHQGIEEKDKNLLREIKHCKFLDYIPPFPKGINFVPEKLKQFSLLTFSRYECFSLLKSYKQVLWLDIDIVVQNDLSNFINSYNSGINLFKTNENLSVNFYNGVPKPYKNELNYNAGIFLLNDDISTPETLKNWCYEKTFEMANDLYCADQGILNILMQEFKLKVSDIGESYNCHPMSKSSKNSHILHAYRPEKFWNFWRNRDWDRNYKTWVKKGGSKYKGEKASLLDVLIKQKWSDAPSPTRQTRKFFKYIYKRFLGNVYKL